MQIAPRTLALQGFRSFRGDTLFEFSRKPGFYLMTGQNLVNPELGANGVGKSTVWDGLAWVLFGKTSRGLRGGTIANWEQVDLTSVLLKFKVGGDKYLLTRCHDPNSLTLATNGGEPKVITQDEVQALIKMDYSTFLYTVLMGQFNRFFFDLSPTEKLTVFSDALRLGYWQERSAKATEVAGQLDKQVRNGEQSLAKVRGIIQTLKDRIGEGKREVKQYEEARKCKVLMLQEQLRDATTATKAAQKRADKLKRKRERMEGKARKYERKLVERDEALKVAKAKVRDAEELIRMAERDMDRLSSQENELKKLKAKGKCPTCFQRIVAKQVNDVVEELHLKWQWEEGELGRAKDQRDAAAKEVEVANRKLAKAGVRGLTAQNRLKELLTKERGAFGTFKASQAGREALAGQLVEAKEAANPYAGQLERDEVELRHAEADKDQIKDSLKSERAEHAAATYWVRGFKELRLWLIEEALLELEVEVNNSLVQLGLEGWLVKFDVERETKAGGVSKGFTVSITSPDSHEPVPWEAWCGGETQRLRIAGAIGLSNLICNRLGIHTGLEVWDEPTAHLSEEGIADLLNFFSARARTEGKQIWLVDHRSLNFGAFDGQVLVTKDALGSRIATRS